MPKEMYNFLNFYHSLEYSSIIFFQMKFVLFQARASLSFLPVFSTPCLSVWFLRLSQDCWDPAWHRTYTVPRALSRIYKPSIAHNSFLDNDTLRSWIYLKVFSFHCHYPSIKNWLINNNHVFFPSPINL